MNWISTNRMVDLVNEGVDLAIRIGDIHQTDVVAKYLCPYRMAICASPEYLARHGTPDARGSGGSSVSVPYRVDGSQRVDTARRDGEVRWKRDAILRCNDGHGLRMAAVAGLGCYCNRRCCWQKSWLLASWFVFWKDLRHSRDRFICCGDRICVRCPS